MTMHMPARNNRFGSKTSVGHPILAKAYLLHCAECGVRARKGGGMRSRPGSDNEALQKVGFRNINAAGCRLRLRIYMSALGCIYI